MRRLAAAPTGDRAASPAAAATTSNPRPRRPPRRTQLTVEVGGAGADPQTIEIDCVTDPCDAAQLDKLAAVTKPPDGAQACTQLYGGPEEAHVTGTLRGEPVDRTIDRSDGCGIADYEALFAALGRKPPVARLGVELVLVLARELLEQLQRGRLRGRRGDLAAAEVLQLRVEARVNGDLVAARVLEHDRARPPVSPSPRSGPAAVRAAVSTVIASSRQCPTASDCSASFMSARWCWLRSASAATAAWRAASLSRSSGWKAIG